MAVLMFIVGAAVLATVTILVVLGLAWVADQHSDSLTTAGSRRATMEAVRRVDRVAREHERAMYEAARRARSGMC